MSETKEKKVAVVMQVRLSQLKKFLEHMEGWKREKAED